MTKEQKEYAEAVESGLKGLDAVSFGVCGGCDDCRAEHDHYIPAEDDETEGAFYEKNPWFVPLDPARRFPAEAEAEDYARSLFSASVQMGKIEDEPTFSWRSCGICNSHLGGDRYVWHWIDSDNNLRHEGDGCSDCLIYVSNGELPDR